MPRVRDLIWVLLGIVVLIDSIKDKDTFNIVVCGFLLIFGVAEVFRNRRKKSD